MRGRRNITQRLRRRFQRREIVDDRLARGTILQVPRNVLQLPGFERRVDVFVEDDLVRVHGYLSMARSFSRALNTCDFEVPSAMPSISAISLCPKPSTS